MKFICKIHIDNFTFIIVKSPYDYLIRRDDFNVHLYLNEIYEGRDYFFKDIINEMMVYEQYYIKAINKFNKIKTLL